MYYIDILNVITTILWKFVLNVHVLNENKYFTTDTYFKSFKYH